MAGDGVRELLLQMRMDNTEFKRSMRDAQQDVRLLKAQFKAAESDTGLEDASDTLRQNLQQQLKLLEDQAESYEKQITHLKDLLGQVGGPESELGHGILGQIKQLQTEMANTDGAANDTKAAIAKLDEGDAMDAVEEVKEAVQDMNTEIGEKGPDAVQKFLDATAGLTRFTEDLKASYGALFGWTEDTADSADEIYAAREYLMAGVKEATNMSAEEAAEFQAWQETMIANSIPLTFEQISAVSRAAGAAMDLSLQELQDFTLLYSKIQTTTELQGEEGVGALATMIGLFRLAADEYENFGSALAVLGDKSRGGEGDLLDIAQRAASAVALFKGAPEDLLALSAAIKQFGAENEAGGSALMRTFTRMGDAAEFGANKYGAMLSEIRQTYPDVKSFYDLSLKFSSGELRRDQVGVDLFGLNESDFSHMLDSAIALEKYISFMGQGTTIEDFVAGWQSNSVEHFISFWTQVGEIAKTGDTGVFDILSALGFNGVRDRTVLANMANMGAEMQQFLEWSRQAYEEGTALDEKYGNFLRTNEARRTMNENAQANMLSVMGQAVVEMRQPFEDWKADMQRWFVEDMPAWVQQGAGAAVQVLGTIGNVITGVSNVAEGLYYTGQTVKSFKEVDWKAVGGTVGKIAGVGVGTVAGVAGLFLLADALYSAATSTETISQNLRNVEIHIDEESKKRALAAIKEVQDASDKLANKEVSEEWAKISRVVKAGYGDIEMFGTAIAYEQTLVEKQLHDLTVSYGLQIDELNSQIIAASDAGDDALAAALMADRETVNAEWKAKAAAVQDAYSLAISQVFNGMLNQREGMADKLEQLNKDYNLLGMLLGLDRGLVINPDTTVRQYKEAYKAAFEAGLVTEADFNRLYNNSKLDASVWAGFGWNNMIKDLLARMSPTISSLFADQNLYGMFTSAVSGGIFDNVDISQVEGSLAAVLAAVNMKNVAAQGGDSIGDWEAGILQILVDALKEGKNQTGPAVEEVRDDVIQQMRDAFSSDSGRMGASAVGAMVTGNLATGILSGKDGAVAAMREVMAAVQAEAVNSAPLVAGVMRMGAGIGLAGATGAGSYHGGTQNTWNQSFTVTGSTIRDQQNIRRLAQEVMKEMRRTSSSVGLG